MRTSTLLLGLALVVLIVVQTTSAHKKRGCGCGCKKSPPPPPCGCGCGAKVKGLKVKGLKGGSCGCKGKGLPVGGGIVSGVVGGVAGGIVGNVVGNVVGGGVASAPVAVLKSLTESQVKERYARQSGESLDVYFKRIICRSYDWTSTTEDYLKTLTFVWKDYPDLPLWYNRQYIDLSKQFYTVYYNKLDSEDWDAYYGRIVRREAWETDDLFAKRITIIRDCFPTLDLWTSEKWFNKYTRKVYACEFKRWSGESEVDYIKRIFEKDSYFDVSDDVWCKRIFLIQEATVSSCPIWYNKDYLSYFTNFYKLYYKVRDNEAADAWLLRTLSPLPGESFDNALTRINFIKQVTGDCGFWKVDYFKQIRSAKLLQEDWLARVQKSFFPCGCGGGAVSISTSSSSASAATSSSSSSLAQSTKIVVA